MSIPGLPDFLKHGDPALQAPMRRGTLSPNRAILSLSKDKGFPERPLPEGGCGDVQNLREEAVRG